MTRIADILAAFPTAAIDHDNLAFYEGQLRRDYLVNRCRDCGHRHAPPRPMCPRCWSTRVEPTSISGRGTVYMAVRIHGAAGAPTETIATVELEEQAGLRVSVVLLDEEPPDRQIGREVMLDWVDGPGSPIPVFRARTPMG